MNQGYITPAGPPTLEPWILSAAGTPPGAVCSGGAAGRNHTLGAGNLRFLAELYAREKGAELAAAYGVTPEGEKIDLLRPSRRRPGHPQAAGVRGC